MNDTVEKISHDASMFDRVGAESLNVTGMLKNHRLARTIAGASMGRLLERVKHKCREVVPAGKFYASSKTCAFCGGHYAELGSKEIWTCPHCGRVCPRDRNAASNLRPSMQAGKPVGQSTEGQREQPNADSRRDGKLRKTAKRKEAQTQGQHDKSAGAASALAGLSSVGMTMAGVQLPLF
jgi:putative transposase